jgi:hypothetical protein
MAQRGHGVAKSWRSKVMARRGRFDTNPAERLLRILVLVASGVRDASASAVRPGARPSVPVQAAGAGSLYGWRMI